MTASTFSRVWRATVVLPLITRLTVPVETPACLAISPMVSFMGFPPVRILPVPHRKG
ncbi:MAG: hypothetical protein H6Q00_3514 [Holophagaceae bacterium]|nr:hypothetical protein [Holophagaceae bacterium]